MLKTVFTYPPPPQDLNILKQRIEDVMASVSPDMLHKTWIELDRRVTSDVLTCGQVGLYCVPVKYI